MRTCLNPRSTKLARNHYHKHPNTATFNKNYAKTERKYVAQNLNET